MNHRTRTALATTALTAVLTAAWLPVSAHAATDGSAGTSSHRAVAPPALAFLSGLVLHPGAGRPTVTVQLPASHAAGLTLLGSGPKGFVIVDDTVDPNKFYTVATSGKFKGKARGFWGQDTPRGLDMYLSHDGASVLIENDGNASGQEFSVFTIYGHKTDGFLSKGNGTGILDYDGTDAVLAVQDAIIDWKVGTTPVPMTGIDGSGADIDKNLLFRDATGGDQGLVPLSAPGSTPRWAVAGFDEFAVSPKGTYVLGFGGGTAAAPVVVRNRSDGTLRSSVSLGVLHRIVGWEDDTHYLAVAHGANGSAVVRCAALTGACVRTTSLVKGRLTLAVGSAFLKDRRS